MSSGSRLYVAGDAGPWEKNVLTLVAERVGASLVLETSAEAAIARLGAADCDALLVDLTLRSAREVLTYARCSPEFEGIAVIALTYEMSDLRFMKALYWGADDLVLWSSVPELIARLEACPRRPPKSPRVARGEALVFEPNRRRCEVIGRVLANAGFEVRYAIDEPSAAYYLREPGLEVVVANASLDDLEFLMQEEVARGEKGVLWCLLAKPDHVRSHSRRLGARGRTLVLDVRTAPDAIVMAINASMAQTSPGALGQGVHYGTMVSFRPEGALGDDYGFSFRVSPGGLFVRSLRGPGERRLWIDLRPPESDRQVRLLAELESSTPLGPTAHAVAPPGFSVRILDGLGDDQRVWEEACRRAAGPIGTSAVTHSMAPTSSEAASRVDRLIVEALHEASADDHLDRESSIDDLLQHGARRDFGAARGE